MLIWFLCLVAKKCLCLFYPSLNIRTFLIKSILKFVLVLYIKIYISMKSWTLPFNYFIETFFGHLISLSLNLSFFLMLGVQQKHSSGNQLRFPPTHLFFTRFLFDWEQYVRGHLPTQLAKGQWSFLFLHSVCAGGDCVADEIVINQFRWQSRLVYELSTLSSLFAMSIDLNWPTFCGSLDQFNDQRS